MKKKLTCITILMLVLLFSLFRLGEIVPPVKADHSTVSIVDVGTSDDASMKASCQPKMFYGAGRWWIIYSNGSSHLYYKSSVSGTGDLGTAVQIASSNTYILGRDISVTFNGSHVHYARFDEQNANLYYRMGTPNSNGTITWASGEHIAVSNFPGGHPNIGVDTNGYAWIFYARTVSGAGLPYVTKNSVTSGSWSTASGFPYMLNETIFNDSNGYIYLYGSVVPLTAGKVAILYSASESAPCVFRCKIYDGSWGPEENVSSALINGGNMHSVVVDGDNIYLMYSREYRPPNWGFINRTWGVGWGTEYNPDIPYNTAVEMFQMDGKIYAIYCATEFYVKSTVIGHNSWSSATLFVNDSAPWVNYDSDFSVPYVNNDTVGFVFQDSTYQIKFATFNNVTIPTITITYPQNKTYTSKTVPVTFSAEDGVIDEMWFNCKNGSTWVFTSNQTYIAPTNMTGFVSGTYTFYAWANNTESVLGYSNTTFTIVTPPTPPPIPPTTPTVPTGIQDFLHYLETGDFLGFFVAAYVFAFHSVDVFFGIVAMFIVVPIYIRTKSLPFLSIAWILLGALFIGVMPLVSGMGLFFLGIGIASLLFQAYTRRGG